MFFIPGAKIYPVMMSIQIHDRGSGIVLLKWCNTHILSVSKYVIINLKSQQFHC